MNRGRKSNARSSGRNVKKAASSNETTNQNSEEKKYIFYLF